MALKNLLLYLDDTKACAKRIDAALALADAHGAHMTALYCIAEFQRASWVMVPPEFHEKQREGMEERAREALQDFRGKAERWGVEYDTRTARTNAETIADELALHARYTDLVVLGQFDPDDPPIGGHHIPEQVVLSAGRPALVVPYIGAPLEGGQPVFGRNVMVAWDAGREAARAVNDAMPLLEKARHVDLVVVNPVKSAQRHGAEPGADMALQLARHDVEVTLDHVDARDMDAGDVILARVSDRGSDLLVMGAYGHSRVRELALGGVTRTVLEQMTVPVLFSH